MKIQNLGRKMAALKWLKEYCLSTSQHGYKYTALPGQLLAERLLWVVILVISIIFCICMVGVEWRKNSHSSTLTALDSSHYPIWNIDFPAVTICSINRICKSKAFQLIKEWSIPSEMTKEQLVEDIRLLSQLIDMSYSDAKRFQRLQAVLDLNNITADAALKEIMLPCEDMFIKCKFKGTLKDCSDLFDVTETPSGFCCSFDYHGKRLKNETVTTTPMGKVHPYQVERASACGFGMGLSVLINNSLQEYYDTELASYGVKVMLHSPSVFPDDNTEEKILSAGMMMLLSVYPVTFQTTHDIEEFELHKRGCILPQERELLNLRPYTYTNCIVECRQNYTIQLCGCSPLFYPTRDGHRTCNMTDIPCLNNHTIDLLEMGQIFNKKEKFEYVPRVISTNQAPCNCLPECLDLWYDIENSEAYMDRDKPMELSAFQFFDKVQVTSDHSLLHVYFIDLVGTRYMRNVYYTWHQQLASIGGVLSLFLGFSLISALEIVYFFTIRVWCYALRSGPIYTAPARHISFREKTSSALPTIYTS